MGVDKSGRMLPFPIGRYAGDGTSTELDYLLGSEYVIEYKGAAQAGSGIAGVAGGILKRVRLVVNDSGVNLKPKRLAQFEDAAGTKTAGSFGCRVKGYARTTNVKCFPIDERLPSAGVPTGCYFYVVTGGPAIVTTSFADAAEDIAVGDVLMALTAATSGLTGGTTTAGRAIKQTITIHSAGTTGYQAALENRRAIGMALSAITTTGTNQDLLVNVGEF